MIVRMVYVHNNENCPADGLTIREEAEIEGGVFRTSPPKCATCFCELELVHQRPLRRYGEDVDTKIEGLVRDHIGLSRDFESLPRDARL